MKIHRVVQMLGATTSTGKLASDMYDLNYKDYYSKEQDRYIPISHMDFQHLVRAFVKQNDEDVRTDTQEGKIKEQAEFYDDVVEKNDKIYRKKIKELELENQRLVQQLEHDETVVSKEAFQDMKERYQHEVNNAEYWRKAYYDASSLQGCYYTFSEVPQDAEGNAFIKNCRKYLNRDSYKIRVKGQHLKPELYGKGRAYHGANMEDSTHMRVYIDNKK